MILSYVNRTVIKTKCICHKKVQRFAKIFHTLRDVILEPHTGLTTTTIAGLNALKSFSTSLHPTRQFCSILSHFSLNLWFSLDNIVSIKPSKKLINHSAMVETTFPLGALTATSIITQTIFLHVPQLPLNTLRAPRPQNQRVSPNTGALYLVKYCTCAHSKVDNAGRKTPRLSLAGLLLPSCLVAGCLGSGGIPGMPTISASHWQISVFGGRGGRGYVHARTHTLCGGVVIICLSARRTCER